MIPMRGLRVNGATHEIQATPDTMLLDTLRNELGLTGAKESCGRGECGACTVLIDRTPVLSCLTFVVRVRGEVTTVEGLADEFADLRQAFADTGGFQCGFCTAGQIVHGAAIIMGGLPADATEAARIIRHRLSGNICRCTGYVPIVDAVLQVAARRSAARRAKPEAAP
jgi:aerobic-type carbon monoxide dehydrogenase small subunit (CoxS/CutS family)